MNEKRRIPPLKKKQRRNIAPNSLTAALYWQQIAQQPAEDAALVAEGDQPAAQPAEDAALVAEGDQADTQPAEQPRPKRKARKRTQEETP
jgi:hypothetical protein